MAGKVGFFPQESQLGQFPHSWLAAGLVDQCRLWRKPNSMEGLGVDRLLIVSLRPLGGQGLGPTERKPDSSRRR